MKPLIIRTPTLILVIIPTLSVGSRVPLTHGEIKVIVHTAAVTTLIPTPLRVAATIRKCMREPMFDEVGPGEHVNGMAYELYSGSCGRTCCAVYATCEHVMMPCTCEPCKYSMTPSPA